MKQNQDHLDYLSGFFATMRSKVEAVKNKMAQNDKELKEAEERSMIELGNIDLID